MRVGYVRVSTTDQNTVRQLDGVAVERTFTDAASGKDTVRPRLEELVAFVRDGDTVLVHSMDRLARNLDDLRRVVRALTGKGVRVEFVAEQLTFSGEDSPMATLMLSVMGAFAEFERALILERQREGIAAAKARGVYTGRKHALTGGRAAELRRRAGAGESKAALAREYGISRETVYAYLRAGAAAVPAASPVPVPAGADHVRGTAGASARVVDAGPAVPVASGDAGAAEVAGSAMESAGPGAGRGAGLDQGVVATGDGHDGDPHEAAPIVSHRSGRPKARRRSTERAVAVAAGPVHQLKITLEEVEPVVWRRVKVVSATTLAQLHQVLQAAMGWQDLHLHAFGVGWDRYGGMDGRGEDSTLAQVLPREGGVMGYQYDFGDDWQHVVEVEKVLTRVGAETVLPCCVAGRRACPPEDCGGPPGYAQMLSALRSRKGWRYQQAREQLGRSRFDVEAFDLGEVNAELARLAVSPPPA